MDSEESLVWPDERKCRECGKIFVIPHFEEYTYILQPGHGVKTRCVFCSWGCMQKFRKRREAKSEKSRIDRKIEQEVTELVMQGLTREAICEQLGVSRETANYVLLKMRKAGKRR